MNSKSFCKNKFRSMLVSGTFTMAVTYIMLLCDNIIAGHFLGESGVAAINLVTPVTGVVTFLSCIVSMGSGIVYSRRIGEMDKHGADKIYGQGMIVSVVLAMISALALWLFRDKYFEISGATGSACELAGIYYRLTPLNAVLTVMIQYLSNMVYTDGDEKYTNLSYGLQIGGNIVLSILLASRFGMIGIILGTVIGNILGILALIIHFRTNTNTLHFVWHFKWKDL